MAKKKAKKKQKKTSARTCSTTVKAIGPSGGVATIKPGRKSMHNVDNHT